MLGIWNGPYKVYLFVSTWYYVHVFRVKIDLPVSCDIEELIADMKYSR